MKPVETANWIYQFLPANAHLRQDVDRNLNEFYLFHYIKREHIPALKENGFDLSNLTSTLAGPAIQFRENSNENVSFNHGKSKFKSPYSQTILNPFLNNKI